MGAGSRHYLVVDAYDRPGRAALTGAGGTAAGRLYARRLRAVEPASEIDVLEVADATTALPFGAELGQYDGVVWTGSNLTIHRPDAVVRRQIELARAAFAAGIPQFGSCWAVHLAAVAAGGECGANPRGREFGITSGLELTVAGREHPLMRGRSETYRAFTSHEDMVTSLPAGAIHLASNNFTEVQALAVRWGEGSFWAVQYHPEYDFHEVACLGWLRRQQLIREGRFADEDEVRAFVTRFEALHRGASELESTETREVGDSAARLTELRNWIAELERLRGRRRGVASS